jgi:WD40 repeat protein
VRPSRQFLLKGHTRDVLVVAFSPDGKCWHRAAMTRP